MLFFNDRSRDGGDFAMYPILPEEEPRRAVHSIPLVQMMFFGTHFKFDKAVILDKRGGVSARMVWHDTVGVAAGLRTLGISSWSTFGVAAEMSYETIIFTLALDLIGAKIVFFRPGMGVEELALRLESFSCEGVLMAESEFSVELLEMTSVLDTVILVDSSVMLSFSDRGMMEEVDRDSVRVLRFWDVCVEVDRPGRTGSYEPLALPVLDRVMRPPKFYLLVNEKMESVEDEVYLGFSDYAVLSALDSTFRSGGVFNESRAAGETLCARPMWTVLGFREVFLNLCGGCAIRLGEGYGPEFYSLFPTKSLSLSREMFKGMMDDTPEGANLNHLRRVFLSLSKYEVAEDSALTGEVKEGLAFSLKHDSWARVSNRLEIPELFGMGTFLDGATEFSGSLGKVMPGFYAEMVDAEGRMIYQQQEGRLILSGPSIAGDARRIVASDDSERAVKVPFFIRRRGKAVIDTDLHLRLDVKGHIYL